MNKDIYRMMTMNTLEKELNKILINYMKVYDEYYETNSRDSAFLKDLVDSLQGISAVLEVYTRDNKIHPGYALEKLKWSKSYIESAINFYEERLNNIESEE